MLTLAFTPESLLFESPWPIVAGLAVVWAVMRLVGARMMGGEREPLGRRLRAGSWGVLGIAAVVLVLAWYVQTPRERMSATMRELLAAVEEEDWARFDELTARDATGSYLGTELSRSQIDGRLDMVKVDDITLLAEGATWFEGTRTGVTVVKLRVQAGGSWEGLEGIAGLDISVWAISWRLLDDGRWEATRFEHQGSGLDESIEE